MDVTLTLVPRLAGAATGPSLTAVSAFSGIGGFEEGFKRAGIETTDLIEWDSNCQTILRRNYPTTNLMGDICDVRARDLRGRPDIAIAGFPCQDLSIAAPHREGLAGKRSHHFYDFTRLLGEYQRLIDESGPEWVVLENTPGLLKSNGGRDMSAVVRALEELGYGWAYRVVDARHLGTSQRRGRVIVVGHRGGEPGPAWEVLGDAGGSGQADPARAVGRRPLGSVPVGGAAFDAVWRKSARARAALDKGGYETWVSDGDANTLTGFDGGGPARQTHLIAQHGRVRTLTLTEWERLQGFEDGWTEGIPDSARFTALGNAVHVGTAAWLGHRLAAVHEGMKAA